MENFVLEDQDVPDNVNKNNQPKQCTEDSWVMQVKILGFVKKD